jgi:DNA topoisomerase-1
MEQREIKKNRSKEEKLKEKEEKKKLEDEFGYAIVDGHKQKVSNYKVEPFGLFLGRGNHPLAGTLKKKIQPEDVTLNLGKDASIPKCPIPGHKWGSIIHNDEVAWLAMWKDISGKNFKYVWLAPSSRVKGESDMKKFERARNLKDHIDDIREEYNKDLKSKDTQTRQRATALYIIDHYALRVGNEKDEDEADTVGCCSLRVEHIKLHNGDTVEFDFLGKDSMRYHNSVKVPPIVYKNFELFMNGKDPKDDLFDQLSVRVICLLVLTC